MQFLNVPPELQNCFKIENGLVRWNLNLENVSDVVKFIEISQTKNGPRQKFKVVVGDKVFDLNVEYSPDYLGCCYKEYDAFAYLSKEYPLLKIEPFKSGYCDYGHRIHDTDCTTYYECDYKINGITTCNNYYNEFIRARSCFNFIGINNDLKIFEITGTTYNLDYLIVDCQNCYTFDRFKWTESINLYHPKLACIEEHEQIAGVDDQVVDIRTCYVCYGSNCDCKLCSAKMFSVFYFEKYKLIKNINENVPTDIIGVILETFMNVCVNYNYTDMNLLFIDKERFEATEEEDSD